MSATIEPSAEPSGPQAHGPSRTQPAIDARPPKPTPAKTSPRKPAATKTGSRKRTAAKTGAHKVTAAKSGPRKRTALA